MIDIDNMWYLFAQMSKIIIGDINHQCKRSRVLFKQMCFLVYVIIGQNNIIAYVAIAPYDGCSWHWTA